MEKERLLIYAFIQHTNNKTGIGQTTGFTDKLSIICGSNSLIGKIIIRWLSKTHTDEKFAETIAPQL